MTERTEKILDGTHQNWIKAPPRPEVLRMEMAQAITTIFDERNASIDDRLAALTIAGALVRT